MKFDRKRLAELQAQSLLHCKALDVCSVKEPGPEAEQDLAQLDEYLQAFVPPGDGKCICCGEQQGASNIMDALLKARFEWGLAHGEGFCSECGYPARAMHYIGEGDDQIRLLNFILQYHPDGLSFEKKSEEEGVSV